MRRAARSARGRVAFTHSHEAPLALLVEKPVETMLSLSDVGVAHRSGAEAGLGLVLPIAVQPWEGGQPVRVLLRGTAMFLPDFASVTDEKGGRPSHLYLLVEVGSGSRSRSIQERSASRACTRRPARHRKGQVLRASPVPYVRAVRQAPAL